ncbi:MAG: hypothetical protein LOY58_10880 [Gammaproteobacteria bacterium]|jgi:hypothetical protein|nr:hypothetical protein [Gammaproteobacteria bacterium]
MHTVYIHINEELDARQLDSIGAELRRLAHVTDVEVNARQPHDVLVEYNPHRGMPMPILRQLSRLGLHADVMSC